MVSLNARMRGCARVALGALLGLCLLAPTSGRAQEDAEGLTDEPEDSEAEATDAAADDTDSEEGDEGADSDTSAHDGGPAAATGSADAASEADSDPLPPLPVERLAERGVELYRAGKHARALKYFLEAYRLDPIPDLLFNIAKVYEAQDEPGLAIEYYQQYVTTEGTRASLRAKAQRRVRALRVEVKRKEEEARAEAARAEAEREAEEERRRRAAAARAGSGAWRTAGWVALGVGAACLASGATYGYLSRRSQSAFDDASWLQDKRTLRERAERRALIADASFAGAAVAGALGVTLLLLATPADDPAPSDTASVQLGPVLVPGQVLGLVVGGSF